MSSGGVNVSRRQAEIGTLHGRCLLPSKVYDLAKDTDPNGNWVYVGKGNVCRIRFTATTGFALISFNDNDTAPAPNAKTQDTVEVDMASTDNYHIVLASADFIRVNSAVSRLEIVQA